MSWKGRQRSSQTESCRLRQEVWILLESIKQENKTIRYAFQNDHSGCAEKNCKGKKQKQIRQVATQVAMAWTTRKANTKNGNGFKTSQKQHQQILLMDYTWQVYKKESWIIPRRWWVTARAPLTRMGKIGGKTGLELWGESRDLFWSR